MFTASDDKLTCFGSGGVYVRLDKGCMRDFRQLSEEENLAARLNVNHYTLKGYLRGENSIPSKHLVKLAEDTHLSGEVRNWYKHVEGYLTKSGKPIKAKWKDENIFPFEIDPKELAICACYIFGKTGHRFSYTSENENDKEFFIRETEKIFGEGSVERSPLRRRLQLRLKTAPSAVVDEIVSECERLPTHFSDALIVAGFRMRGYVPKHKRGGVRLCSASSSARYLGDFKKILEQRGINVSFWQDDRDKWGGSARFNVGVYSENILKFAKMVMAFTNEFGIWQHDKKFQDLTALASSLDKDLELVGLLSEKGRRVYESLPESVWKRG